MIESKKTPEERAQEAVTGLQRKHEALTKAKGAAQLANARVGLVQLEFENAQRAAFAKFPEAVRAAGLAPAEG